MNDEINIVAFKIVEGGVSRQVLGHAPMRDENAVARVIRFFLVPRSPRARPVHLLVRPPDVRS